MTDVLDDCRSTESRPYEAPTIRQLGTLTELTLNSGLFFGHTQSTHADMSMSGGGTSAPPTGVQTGGAPPATVGTVNPVHTSAPTHTGTGTSPTGSGGTTHHGGSGSSPTGSGGSGTHHPGSGSSPGGSGSNPGSGSSPGSGSGSSPAGATSPADGSRGGNTSNTTVNTGSSGSLPFTGLEVGAVAAIGAFASAAGAVMRRRLGRRGT